MDKKELHVKENFAIEELSRDLKTNKFVKGEMQFTDITNAVYFLRAYGDIIRYCYSWKKFLIWDGSNWVVDSRGQVESMCLKFVHKMYRGLRVIDDPQLRRSFERHLIKSESFRRIQSLVGTLKISEEIITTEDELDKDVFLLNVKDLTLNLKTGKGRKPDSKQLITKQSRFVFDKEAKCPVWNMFLMQIFNNDISLIHYIQKVMGYALSGDTSEQCMFILWGCGANGKSTFLNTIQQLMGDYACTASIETFMKKRNDHSNDLARLKGMRLVTTSEVEQGQAISESLIKVTTGEDEITARFLYGEYFSFKPTFKIFMATNHMPKIRGGDNGIWRRVKMIPFNVTIPPEKRDKHLTEKLLAENSGILNWLLQGYVNWKKEGLSDEPPAIKNANEEYRMDMDVVGTFIMECLDLDATLSWRLPTTTLYNTYIKWCNKNNEKIMSQKWLSMRIFEKGYKRKATNGQRVWLGLAIKPGWIA